MSPQTLQIVAVVLGVAAVVVVGVAVGEWLARRKIESLGARQRLRAVGVQGGAGLAWTARLDPDRESGGLPQSWSRTPPACGGSGWLLYTSPWHSLGRQAVEVRWDESPVSVGAPIGT